MEWPGWLKWEETAAVAFAVEWIVCCLSIFFKAFTKYQRLVSPIYCYYDDDDDDDYYFIIIIMILCYGW